MSIGPLRATCPAVAWRREAGARYLVEDVFPSGRGGFHRAYGEVRRLV